MSSSNLECLGDPAPPIHFRRRGDRDPPDFGRSRAGAGAWIAPDANSGVASLLAFFFTGAQIWSLLRDVFFGALPR